MEQRDQESYTNTYCDPNPIQVTAKRQEKKTKNQKWVLRDYGQEILKEYKDIDIFCESLWLEFITFFRPYSIGYWSQTLRNNWNIVLFDRKVQVETGDGIDLVLGLVDPLYRDNTT